VLTVAAFEPGDARRWDDLVTESVNGTLMHTRRYLSHHGDRFFDRSLVVLDERDRWLAVLPAADHDDGVSSHPGLSYGGLVWLPALRGAEVGEAILGCREHLGVPLRYKATPVIYHRRPAADDLYALWRLGATRYRCDLSATVDIATGRLNALRRRGLRKAGEAGLVVSHDRDHLAAYWSVLEATLSERHGVRPTHELDQFAALMDLFPDAITLVTALADGRVVAGTAVYRTPMAWHTQYVASTDEGRDQGAVDLVLTVAIEDARDRGARWFDFGNSNENGGMVLNGNLHQFKTSFGAGGTVAEHYRLP
jgi:hypothetical protein